MSKLLNGTHHICLNPRNAEEFDQAFRFYHEVLGMDVVRSYDGFAMLDTGDGTVMELYIGSREDGPGSISHFAFRTNDLDACIAAVTAAGRPITDGPKSLCLPCDPPYSIRVAFTVGMLGESVEFLQEC